MRGRSRLFPFLSYMASVFEIRAHNINSWIFILPTLPLLLPVRNFKKWHRIEAPHAIWYRIHEPLKNWHQRHELLRNDGLSPISSSSHRRNDQHTPFFYLHLFFLPFFFTADGLLLCVNAMDAYLQFTFHTIILDISMQQASNIDSPGKKNLHDTISR